MSFNGAQHGEQTPAQRNNALHHRCTLLELVRTLHHFEADAVVYRPRQGDVLSSELHVVDAASDARSLREGGLLVPRVLKGLGVESWLTVATIRRVLQGHDLPSLSDAQVLDLFVLRT